MRASITAPLHSAQRGTSMRRFRRSQERMMRPTNESHSVWWPSNLTRMRPRSITIGNCRVFSRLFLASHLKATLGVPRRDGRMVGPVFAQRLDAELGICCLMLVVTHPDAKAARKRVEPLDQRGLGLTGCGALAKLGHKRN